MARRDNSKGIGILLTVLGVIFAVFIFPPQLGVTCQVNCGPLNPNIIMPVSQTCYVGTACQVTGQYQINGGSGGAGSSFQWTVSYGGSGTSATTDSSGYFIIGLTPQSTTVTGNLCVPIPTKQTSACTAVTWLANTQTYPLTVTVLLGSASTGASVAGATVTASGPYQGQGVKTGETNSNGVVVLNLPAGTYTISAQVTNCLGGSAAGTAQATIQPNSAGGSVTVTVNANCSVTTNTTTVVTTVSSTTKTTVISGTSTVVTSVTTTTGNGGGVVTATVTNTVTTSNSTGVGAGNIGLVVGIPMILIGLVLTFRKKRR